MKISDLKSDKKRIFCHICGTHEYTIVHNGIRPILSENIEIRCGPGCPVCVTPTSEIDAIIDLAKDGITICTFGDMLRVPGTEMSLSDAKALGHDIRGIYSISDSIDIARNNPDLDVVHFAVGFETTAPTTAAILLKDLPSNFSVFCSHKLIPPAMEHLLQLDNLNIDGFICPGHVSTIIGVDPYEFIADDYNIPCVISGFEGSDVIKGLNSLIKQCEYGKAKVENQYQSVVKKEGNKLAKKALKDAFDICDVNWRGLGKIKNTGYKIKDKFSKFDTTKKYDVSLKDKNDMPKGCKCHLVLIGQIYPNECPLFMKKCTPDSPVGPCAVSREGACYIVMRHEKF